MSDMSKSEVELARLERKREYDRRYRAEHREQILEQKSRYRAENREQRREQQRRYYAENRERIREQQRMRRAAAKLDAQGTEQINFDISQEVISMTNLNKHLSKLERIDGAGRQRTFIFNDDCKIRAVIEDDRTVWLISVDVLAALRRGNTTRLTAIHSGVKDLKRCLKRTQYKQINWCYASYYSYSHTRNIWAVNKQGLYALSVKRMRMNDANK